MKKVVDQKETWKIVAGPCTNHRQKETKSDQEGTGRRRKDKEKTQARGKKEKEEERARKERKKERKKDERKNQEEKEKT